MGILIIREPVNETQLSEMAEVYGSKNKVAVDVGEGILAGGGEMHADCEEALLEIGCRQEDIWGADWIRSERKVEFESFINIRPRHGNRSMEVQDPELRSKIEIIVRKLLDK